MAKKPKPEPTSVTTSVRTFAIYMRPRGTDKAVRHRGYEPFTSAKLARQTRRAMGPDAAIHAGTEHPDELPFGETLWLEAKK